MKKGRGDHQKMDRATIRQGKRDEDRNSDRWVDVPSKGKTRGIQDGHSKLRHKQRRMWSTNGG